ncbi:hypothetical protein Goshw_001924 [Gossypium schwendimanii]|uniref:Uncharacterized protein n=1 Tax=Gossypium schwendimanii TaxID=34291 RepID=A0A7J9N6W7_GOSSC|nr:hypothetical protein [Gossypium schwendimanii]
MDDDVGPLTRPRHSPDPSSVPIQSPGPVTAPTQSLDPVVQWMIPTVQPFQMMPGAFESMARFISIFDYTEWTANV